MLLIQEGITMSISDNIKRFRESMGLSQAQLGDMLGISDRTVSSWELGTRTPRMGVIERMCAYFNITKSELLDDRAAAPDWMPSNVTRIPPLRSIPLIGSIACGTPILAAQNIEANIFLPETVNADYALRCKGDSMTGADILDGDIVYIRQDADVINGQIYAVMIGEGEVTEATLKHVYQTPDTLTLTADNPAYPPMIYQGEQLARIRIIGKAVGFTRKI